VSQISFKKTGFQSSNYLPNNFDMILWFAKDFARLKFRRPYINKLESSAFVGQDVWFDGRDGHRRRLNRSEKENLLSFSPENIFRQKEIDASIAAKAEFEYLYDKPYVDNRKVRVAGPFTVESLSPHRVLGVDENDELIDSVAEHADADYMAKQTFPQMILENLRIAGVQQAHRDDRIVFTSL